MADGEVAGLSMVERVARDIHMELCGLLSDDESVFAARAAIAAMREPTVEMRAAADKIWDDHGIPFGSPDEIWPAMIAAALVEPDKVADPGARKVTSFVRFGGGLLGAALGPKDPWKITHRADFADLGEPYLSAAKEYQARIAANKA